MTAQQAHLIGQWSSWGKINPQEADDLNMEGFFILV